MKKNFISTIFLASIIATPPHLFSYESESKTLFRGDRIPSLILGNNGRLIAAADRRFGELADWNNIDTVIRYSDDFGNTFTENKTIIDLVEANNNNAKSAFLIDAAMVKTNNDILLLVDMFPKSRGFFSVANSEPGSGYELIDGKYYQKVKKFGSEDKLLIDDEGFVYKKNESGDTFTLEKQKSLKVIRKSEKMPFKDLGDIYENGERIGNVYRGKTNGDNNPNDYDGEYLVNTTAYLWLTRSKDNGETWSSPVDITRQFKKDYMSFIGTGPGVGIKLKHGPNKGRIIFPVYFTTAIMDSNMSRREDGRSQQTAVIYSDDDGKTFKISESIMENRVVRLNNGTELTLSAETPRLGGFQLTEAQVVELNSGTLKMFMRGFKNSSESAGGAVHVGTSKDGGVTWEDNVEELSFVKGPYSQVAAIHYGNIGSDEFVLVASPDSHERSKRINGTLFLAKVDENDNLVWIDKKLFKEGPSAYQSIAKLPNGDIAILYESGGGNIDFKVVSIDEIAKSYIFKDMLPFTKYTITEINNDRFKNIIKDIENIPLPNTTEKANIYFNGNSEEKTFGALVPINKNISYYQNISKFGENTYFSAGLNGKIRKNYFVFSSNLGFNYLDKYTKYDAIRKDHVKTDIDYMGLNGNIRLGLEKEVSNFTINPYIQAGMIRPLSFNIKASDDKNHMINFKNSYNNLNARAGLIFSYKTDISKVDLDIYKSISKTKAQFEDEKIEYVNHDLNFRSNVTYNITDNLGLGLDMNYSQKSNMKFGFSLNFNK